MASRAACDDSGWLPVVPSNDELLSSFLSRCARHHGMRPTVFCAHYLKPFSIWNRDIDRSASPALMQSIARLAHLTPQQVEAMTLRGWQQSLHSTSCDDLAAAGVAPWISAAGIYHRTRRRYGLNYCVYCLEQRPAFRRMWRLAFVTVCSTHQALLSDSCGSCGSPIIPHHQHVSGLYCGRCGAYLCHVHPSSPSDSLAMSDVLHLQEELLRALDARTVVVGDQVVAGSAYLEGVRFLAGRLRLLDDRSDGQHGDRRHVPFELRRCHARHGALCELARLLSDWPANLLRAATLRDWTQRPFHAEGPPPEWISRALESLPAGKRAHQCHYHADARRGLGRSSCRVS